MAAKINNIITAQSFEIIRDQIALILGLEIRNQVLLSGNYEIDATVYIERQVPPNASEMDAGPLVNVLLGTGDYSNQDVSQSTGTYLFFIDVYTGAKSSSTKNGDTRSMLRMQKMLGVCRGILEATQYLTLGFVPPFVMGRKINSLQIAQPDAASADNIVRGRLVLEVKVPEYQQMVTANLIDGQDTTVFIDTSDEGYFWVNDSY